MTPLAWRIGTPMPGMGNEAPIPDHQYFQNRSFFLCLDVIDSIYVNGK
jgi:hypothetical protein